MAKDKCPVCGTKWSLEGLDLLKLLSKTIGGNIRRRILQSMIDNPGDLHRVEDVTVYVYGKDVPPSAYKSLWSAVKQVNHSLWDVGWEIKHVRVDGEPYYVLKPITEEVEYA